MLVVISDAVLATFRERVDRQLPPGIDVRWVSPGDDEALAQAIMDADVLVSSRCPAAVAQQARRLRLVQTTGAGVEMVDADALPDGASVANTFHHEDSIAEYVLTMAIALRRGFITQDRALRSGDWLSPLRQPGLPWHHTLAKATVGFIGFGHIGTRAWQAFRGFGARGVAVTRSGRVDTGQELAWTGGLHRLPDLLHESDVVVLSAPLTEGSTGMIGQREFAIMKSSAVLINVGRGPLINEAALYQALHDSTIAAAAIDVWYRYPSDDARAEPSQYPLADLDNIVMTPHISGVTAETFEARIDDIADNILGLSRGEPLRNVVTTPR